MDKNILFMKNITKTFPGTKALDDVNFKVKKGEVHCLVGANGAGKSTLMKILSGVYQADKGEIFLEDNKVNIDNPLKGKRLGISVIYQELSLVSELSVTENIFLGNYINKKKGYLNWEKMKNKAQEVIDELNINIDVRHKVKNLSMGHQQMVELAKALVKEDKIIVMDEPSATLSSEEFDTLVRVINDLKEQGMTIIYISHRLEEIFKVGDRVTVLRNGEYIDTVDVDEELTENKIAKMMIGHSIDHLEREQKKFKDEEVLKVNNIVTDKLKSISMKLRKNEVLGLYGLVGSGRTELLRVLYGIDDCKKGEIFIADNLVNIDSPDQAKKNNIGLVPEERQRQSLIVRRPLWENIILSSIDNYTKNGVMEFESINNIVDDMISKLNIKTSSKYEKVKNLSGGNQQKVAISKWLVQNSNILLLDEPTQGIDVGAKEEIYMLINELIQQHDKSIIMASSELNELLNVADRIIVMHEGKIIEDFTRDNFKKELIQQTAILGRRLDDAI